VGTGFGLFTGVWLAFGLVGLSAGSWAAGSPPLLDPLRSGGLKSRVHFGVRYRVVIAHGTSLAARKEEAKWSRWSSYC
jgi:hypothetical protein